MLPIEGCGNIGLVRMIGEFIPLPNDRTFTVPNGAPGTKPGRNPPALTYPGTGTER